MNEYSASILEPLLASFVVSMVSLVAVGVAPLLSFVRDTAFTSAKEKNRGSSKANFARELALFGSGALLADACTHGVPNSFGNEKHKEFAGSCFLVGVLTFYVLDCFIRSRVSKDVGASATTQKRTTRSQNRSREKNDDVHHHHQQQHQHSVSSAGWLNLFADGLHNFTGGIALAVSFKKGGRKAGVATSTALATHELPQEIGDYGVLINCGFSHEHALWFNFLSATLSIVGTVFAWHIGNVSEKWEVGLEAFCAAGFVFVSISQIVTVSAKEEKNNNRGKKRSYARDVMSVLLGVFVVYQVHAVLGCCGGHEEGHHRDDHHHHSHHDEY